MICWGRSHRQLEFEMSRGLELGIISRDHGIRSRVALAGLRWPVFDIRLFYFWKGKNNSKTTFATRGKLLATRGKPFQPFSIAIQ